MEGNTRIETPEDCGIIHTALRSPGKATLRGRWVTEEVSSPLLAGLRPSCTVAWTDDSRAIAVGRLPPRHMLADKLWSEADV